MATLGKARSERRPAPPAGEAGLRAWLADIVEFSNDAIYSRTLDGAVSSWNAAAERIFGYRADEIVGQPSALLVPPDRPDETRRLLECARRGERVEHFETVRRRKDGTLLKVSLCVSPIRDARGRVVGASTIARDITRARELEGELIVAGERERQRLGRDLHDGLGQHLTGMSLLCQTLARSLARQGRREAKTAALLATQMEAAIGQTRALARGLAPVMDSPGGLMLALQDFCTAMNSLFRVKCLFRCEEPILIPEHNTAMHLFRITQESVSNALRHGHARRIEISLTRRAARLVLQVRDHGSGLQPGRRPANGMGLRFMRYRAQMMEGTVRVANSKPHGVLVTCTVPWRLPAKDLPRL